MGTVRAAAGAISVPLPPQLPLPRTLVPSYSQGPYDIRRHRSGSTKMRLPRRGAISKRLEVRDNVAARPWGAAWGGWGDGCGGAATATVDGRQHPSGRRVRA